jgi:hypothetical protein
MEYDESSAAQKSKVNVTAILRSTPLLTTMYTLQSNLSVSRSTMKEAIAILATELGPGWGLKEEHMEDYIMTMTCRVCNMNRHVAQAELRKPPPAWIQKLPWRAPVANLHSQASVCIADAASGAIEKDEFTMENKNEYDFWDELKLAARYSVNGNRKNKQYDVSLPITVSPEARDEDPVVATWADGDAQTVTGLTVGMVRAWTTPHARNIIFEGCTLSQHTASLSRKKRRRDERRQWQGAYGHL